MNSKIDTRRKNQMHFVVIYIEKLLGLCSRSTEKSESTGSCSYLTVLQGPILKATGSLPNSGFDCSEMPIWAVTKCCEFTRVQSFLILSVCWPHTHTKAFHIKHLKGNHWCQRPRQIANLQWFWKEKNSANHTVAITAMEQQLLEQVLFI